MIRPLAEIDDPSGFSCGYHELDRYLKKHAFPNAASGVSITYVHADPTDLIDGYVTLAGTSIRSCDARAVDVALPSYPLPALLVARLAVRQDSRSRGIGRALLLFALEEAMVLHGRTGCVAVVVDAKPDAVDFYTHFGFERVDTATPVGSPIRLLLEIGSVLDALA